nr:hypothetical protein [uncultured Flavobacterium sp.]
MKILIFQIALFLLITFIGYVSRLRLNIITFIAVIFTFFMVKTLPLVLLQFATIILAYLFVNKRGTLDEIQKKVDEHNKRNKYY